jgi:hypothetical protein
MLDRKVDSSSEEGGRQDKTDNLDLEACLTPRVVVHDQSSGVTNTFSETSNDNSDGEALQASLDSEKDLSEAQDSEHDTEEDVSSEVRSISIGGSFHWTVGCDFCAVTASHLVKSRRRCLRRWIMTTGLKMKVQQGELVEILENEDKHIAEVIRM